MTIEQVENYYERLHEENRKTFWDFRKHFQEILSNVLRNWICIYAIFKYILTWRLTIMVIEITHVMKQEDTIVGLININKGKINDDFLPKNRCNTRKILRYNIRNY